MADRIAILGGEPYAEWIKRDDKAQRLYKAYRDRWPESDAQCVAIGSELYVRFSNGNEMRRVHNVGDFDDEDEWCAQCGTPVDPDGGGYYGCDFFACDAVLCDNCGDSQTCDGHYCPQHRGSEAFMDHKEAEYIYPYAFGDGNQFTFGVEIELESELSDDFVKNVTTSDVIAGWGKDASLDNRNGIELQSNILDMSKLPALKHIVEGIPEYGDDAGGHIHVARTDNQCASRWYWALRGLSAYQCRLLNMRHIDDDHWCSLTHGGYTGKHTAVNNEHADTIELRTFGCWYAGSADKLVLAVKWIRAMWRFFEKHPRGTIGASSIEQYSSCMADNVTDTPRRTISERLNEARRAKAARKAEEEHKRRARAAEIRRNVEKNVNASRFARRSHGDTRIARREWADRQNRRARNREAIDGCLSNTMYAYAFPSRNLRPLHTYLNMAAAKIVERGETFRSLERFRIYHAATGGSIWNGFECRGRHGETAQRVIDNILRSRIARASHGKPTTESLERTALRLYKRAGRPELSSRYARIRKGIVQADAER